MSADHRYDPDAQDQYNKKIHFAINNKAEGYKHEDRFK